MKISKQLFLFFVIFLLMSCTTQQIETSQPKTNLPAQTSPLLDFDHPRLYEIAGNSPLIIREIARTRRYFDGVPYVAVIIDTGDSVFKVKMLIFRLEKTNATLIYESEPYVYMSFDVVEEDPSWLMDNSNYYYYRSVMGGIYPIDENYLIVPFHVGNGGNCYDCSGMRVVGITKDGNAKDITPSDEFNAKTYIDLNGKFQFEIIATRYYEFDYGACDHVSSPFAFRLFQWQGTAYTDISENEKDFYDQKIAELTIKLQEFWGEPLHACWVMPTLANIFFDYESSGRVEYGWEQIQALGDLNHWDIQNTPPEEIQTYHDVFDQLEQRKNEDLTTATP